MAISFTACGDDDDDNNVRPSAVPEVCADAFSAKYPDVKSPKWEQEGNYYTAEWTEINGMRDVEAWFKVTSNTSDSWVMTETDYGKNLFLVPTGLNTSFNDTEYSEATIDDISLFEYPDATKDVYVIEVSPAGMSNDMLLLFKASDYSYIKAMTDTDRDITPDTVLF